MDTPEPAPAPAESPAEAPVEAAADTPAAAAPAPTEPAPTRLEAIAEQILLELRRGNEQAVTDFSASKLLAGIVQVLALAALFVAYLRRDTDSLQSMLLVSLTLQTLTISLLIMGRQR